MHRYARALRRFLVTGALLLVAAPALPAPRDTLTDPATLLSVDGRAYPAIVADILFATARNAKPDLTWAEFLDGIAENQLMAKHALTEMGRAQLMASDKVGFTPEVVLQDQYLTLVKRHFYKDIDATVRALPGGNLDKLVKRRLLRDNPSVKELMTLRDLAEVRLTPEQLALARKTVVSTVTMPDGKAVDLTWFDLYQRENVQGRTKLMQEKDFAYLDTRILTRAEALFLEWWMDNRSPLTAPQRDLLRRMLEEKYLRENYMLQAGVVSTMHEDMTPAMEKMQKTVTREEVRAWYEKNKDMFKQVERVKARHIRCATEADCNAARDAIAKGMEFSLAARKFSLADSRNADPAGSLGWIHREAKNLPWLQQLAFIQPKGQVSQPVRTPENAQGKATWEIILVDERIEGFSAPDSETVRYQAVQEIAKRKLIERYLATRDGLVKRADIRRNPVLLREREKALASAPPPPPMPRQRDDHGHGHGHAH